MRFLFTILISLATITVTAQVSDTIIDLSRSRTNKPVVDSTIIPVAIASDPKAGFQRSLCGQARRRRIEPGSTESPSP